MQTRIFSLARHCVLPLAACSAFLGCGSGSADHRAPREEATSNATPSTEGMEALNLGRNPDYAYVSGALHQLQTLEFAHQADWDQFLAMSKVGYLQRCTDDALGFSPLDCGRQYVFTVSRTSAGFTATATSPLFPGFVATTDQSGNTTGLPIVVTVDDVKSVLKQGRTLEFAYYGDYGSYATMANIGAGTKVCVDQTLGFALSNCPANGVAAWIEVAPSGVDFLVHVSWANGTATMDAAGIYTGP